MRILHYSLGFPPYRTGGLTKFCMDLMNQQIIDGHNVSLLWPGECRLFDSKTRIRHNKSVNGIGNYEIINPLPVSYDEGIKDFDIFMQAGDKRIYNCFLKQLQPEVIHIHTLMGLHKNFMLAAKELQIRIVFTAHDFFPICPKVTMFRHGKICESIYSCKECGICNNTALSLGKIKILQSSLYRNIKDSKIIKKIRKQHRDEYLSDDPDRDNNGIVGFPDDYLRLRRHYQEMLSLVNVVHYNSTVTKEIYDRIFDVSQSRLISITHSDISDHRIIKTFSDAKIRIRYLGPYGASKGFYILKKALDELWKERHDFCLDIHFVPKEISPYMITHNRYNYGDLENIFAETDVMVAPSIWYETFGFTVLEALSYGVPVVISGTVGAKDILADGAGIVVENISAETLVDILRGLTSTTLTSMNMAIVNKQYIMTIQDMAKEITDKCYMEV